jgi:outer membrane protein assembly factor BamB
MLRNNPVAVALVLLLSGSLAAALPAAKAPDSSPPKLWSADLAPGEGRAVAPALGGGALVAGNEGGDALLASSDATGARAWSASYPGAAWQGLAALADGSAAVTGVSHGATEDALTALYDADGRLQWVRAIRTAATDEGRGIAASQQGLFVVGTTGLDVLASRYDPDGTHRWARRLGSAAEEHGEAVAMLPDGPALVGWDYDGARNRLLLWHLDELGAVVWQRSVAWPGSSLRGHAASSDAQGDLLVGGVLADAGGSRPFAAKFDKRGELSWLRVLDTMPQGAAYGIAADALGGAVLAGSAAGFPSARDWFLARFTPQGGLAWEKRFDTGGEDEARGVALDGGLLTVGGTASGWLAAARYLDAPARAA